ncbi:MAG: prepilin-type N-terminal cleavage/methylation domain-containing protein [Candidatus Omnitrophota bacterium]
MKRIKGLTLVEVLVAMAILAVVALSMFMVYPALFENVTLSSENMKAFEAAKRQMEALVAANYTDLYNVSYNTTPVANNFTPQNLLNSTGVYYVKRLTYANLTDIPNLLDLEVVVSYKVGARTIGEDQNLNWVLDAGEDIDSNGKINSTIKLSTLIFNQNL